MTTSGRQADGNLAGHPFGVNAKWLQTHKQTAEFRPVWHLSGKCNWDWGSSLLRTRAANWPTVRSCPGPVPEVTVRNRS